MKHTFNKNILALLVLATAGLSAGAHAANQATVKITATVAEKLELAVNKTTVAFTDGKLTDDIVITTSNNHAAKITVTGDESATGEHFNLQQVQGTGEQAKTYTMPVTASIEGDAAAKFDEAHVMTHSLTGNATDTQTTLHLAATPGDNQEAGTYNGTLVIKIEKA